jgi:hypothetical protein
MTARAPTDVNVRFSVRAFVAVVGVGSGIAALVLMVVLAIENMSWGSSANILPIIAVFSVVPLFTLYHVHRMLRAAYRPGFPRENLGPIAALLILGAVLGLGLVGASITGGPHGAALFILGLVFQLLMVCAARYKFAA